MPTTAEINEAIKTHEARIKHLQKTDIAARAEKAAALRAQADKIDAEIKEDLIFLGLEEKAPAQAAAKKGNSTRTEGKKPNVEEIRSSISSAPDKKISFRKAPYDWDTAHVKKLAKKEGSGFEVIKGKGPWPIAQLVK